MKKDLNTIDTHKQLEELLLDNPFISFERNVKGIDLERYTTQNIRKELIKRQKRAVQAKIQFENEFGKYPICDKEGNMLPLIEGEEWRQCFDAGHCSRWWLTPNWFVSDKSGYVITVYNKKLYWLGRGKMVKEEFDDSKYTKILYHIQHPFRKINPKTGKKSNSTKSIYAHDLQAIVFSDKVKWLGNSKWFLDNLGIYAFSGEMPIEVHHKYGKGKYPNKAYDISNMQVAIRPVHRMLEKAPNLYHFDKDIEYMEDVSAILPAVLDDDIKVAFAGSFNAKTGKKIPGSYKAFEGYEWESLVADETILKVLLDAQAFNYAVLIRQISNIDMLRIPVKLYVRDDKTGKQGFVRALYLYCLDETKEIGFTCNQIKIDNTESFEADFKSFNDFFSF